MQPTVVEAHMALGLPSPSAGAFFGTKYKSFLDKSLETWKEGKSQTHPRGQE